jgi:hypothetical protein
MRNRHLPGHIYPLSHLDRTNYYERVVAASGEGTFQAQYAELVAVASGSPTTVLCPVVGGTEQTTKDTFHFGVISLDGTGSITILGNGHDVNNGTSITLAASPGASAHLYFSNTLGQWLAFVGGAGALELPPPTYTAKGPPAPQTFTNAGFTAVTGASITTAPFSASQKAIVAFSAVVFNSASTEATADIEIFDGVVGTPIDSFEQHIDEVTEGTFDYQVISWTLEVPGNGSARTFGLALTSIDTNTITINANRCRGTVQIVDG